MTAPRVTVVVLTWNNYRDTVECLASIRASATRPSELLVVDNGSTDDSPDRIAREFPEATMIRIPSNQGYAAGANHGLDEACRRGADLVLFLAADTTIAPEMIGRLVTTAMTSSQIGIIGPRIMHHDAPMTLQHGAGYINALGQAVNRPHEKTTDCEWVTGCGFMVRASTLRALPEPRGFDERFFAYWEDVDFSFRIAAAGYRVVYEPAAEMWHKESAATQRSESMTKKRSRNYYLLRNQFLFARRHLPRTVRMRRFVRGLTLEMPRSVLGWIRRQGLSRDVLLVLRAYRDGVLGRGGRAPYPGLY
jgi:GT2 family glycosyltransferase